MTLIRVEHLVKTFAGVPVLQDVSWQIEAGRNIGLIGTNGSGKSTLLNIMSGVMTADSGTVERARALRLGYLTQEMTVEGDRTLYEEVREAFRPLLDMQEEMTILESRLAQQTGSAADLQRYGTLLEEFNARQGYTMAARVDTMAARVDTFDMRMDTLAQRMNVLTERTIQAMDAINRLGRIAANHEDRIDGLEHPSH